MPKIQIEIAGKKSNWDLEGEQTGIPQLTASNSTETMEITMSAKQYYAYCMGATNCKGTDQNGREVFVTSLSRK